MRKSYISVWMIVLATLVACTAREVNDAEVELMAARETMMKQDIERRGVKNRAVLDAMRSVPRHEFVESEYKAMAYDDRPLPIAEGQTISQPYIVAAMTELVDPRPGDVMLEVGTGSGYQAAVLAEIVEHVYTIEIIPILGKTAEEKFQSLELSNISVRVGDGYAGWPEHAPFDGIIVTCGAEEVPQPLVDQLKPGGKMVIPVGPFHAVQELLVITKNKDGSVGRRSVMPVRFVPMTGKAMNDGQ